MEPQTMADLTTDHPTHCTLCGAPAETLRRFPFTTRACPACAAKLDAAAEEERHDGRVCPRCKEPYSRCWH